ncbi:FAD-binding oxidoreductase [Aestuariivita sp.]|jgi:glycine/D-amino acid oxidase-like deaminating enzyme|uniref:NAD(P)/FAD-dependent oxidoreductase n=1 Tax=Aestuariivita sp. TaxID=1872407 RepID=UPI00217157B5|nr:FAD-binding oxidoreductase [Aestuariivita sp.]MCE8007706.1 FAD-binding oxidoreductase [Aestuariivita sp.]
MTAQRVPYWWSAAGAPTSPPQTPLPVEVDVVVIGAGLTGLSAALTLAGRGKSVLTLDARAPGEGASSRNGGMIGGGHRLSVDAMEAQFGHATATRLLREAHVQSRRYALDLMEREGIDCDYAETGRFRGLWTSKEYDSAARGLERLQALIEIDAWMVPRRAQFAEAGTDLYAGGTVYATHGGLDPAKWVAGLRAAAIRAGAVAQGHTPVTSLARSGRGHVVTTPRGGVRCGTVLAATNGYTDAALAWARRRIVPIPSYVMASAPMRPEMIATLFPKGRMVAESRERHCYYRPSPDGRRILFGGRAAMFQMPGWFAANELRSLLRRVFPDLGEAEISHVWSGRTGFTFSFLPHVGQLDGIWHAMGYSGSGNAMAPWLGHKAACAILGDAEGETAFRKTLFPTRPWHHGHPWFLPAADVMFRARDIVANLRRAS